MHLSPPVLRTMLLALVLIIAVAESGKLIAAIDPTAPAFPTDPDKVARPLTGSIPATHRFLALLRPDVRASDAMLLTFDALGSKADDGKNARAQAAAKWALSTAPVSGQLWLCLSLLQQHAHETRLATEALKMAYFIAPNDASLMPVRLDTATRGMLLRDQDLRQLARGDVRQMLQTADLKNSLLLSYRRASEEGRTFLRTAVADLDPALVQILGG